MTEVQRDITAIAQHTHTRIKWASTHDASFYDDSLRFWVKCLYRTAVDKYHPNLGPQLRGYCRIVPTLN